MAIPSFASGAGRGIDSAASAIQPTTVSVEMFGVIFVLLDGQSSRRDMINVGSWPSLTPPQPAPTTKMPGKEAKVLFDRLDIYKDHSELLKRPPQLEDKAADLIIADADADESISFGSGSSLL